MVLLFLSVTELTQIVSLFIALASCIFFGVQVKQKINMSHVEEVAKMMTKTQSDPRLQCFFYDLEYNRFQYSFDFHGSDLERRADELLHHYEYVLYLQKRGLLKNEEFHFFEYDIQRIVGNKSMQDYLFNLYHFVDWGTLSFKYQRLLNYGKENGFISSDFDNPGSVNYEHVIYNGK